MVTQPQNLRYLSGFTGDSSWILVSGRERILFTDGRYTSQAQEECPGWMVFGTKTGLSAALKDYAGEAGFMDLAYDYCDMTVETHQRLLLTLEGALSLTGEEDPCYTLRQTKDSWELYQIEKAASIADEALTELRPKIKAGVSERWLATELYYLLCRLGSEGVAFDTIVAAGPQSAWPHARPTDYRIAQGDFVTIDFGAVVNGYRSDTTRTFIMGAAGKLQKERYHLVLEAQKKALAEIKPGAYTRVIDSVARDLLTDAGCGEFFGHGLGHSFGLDIHEEPRFSQLAADTPLAAGMTMTVEPGIYIPGWGGLRIEDCVMVTKESLNTFSRFPKTLEEMVII